MTCAGTVPAALVVLVAGDGLVVDDVEAVVEVEVVVETVVEVEVGVVVGVGVDPPHAVTARRATDTTHRPRVMAGRGVDDMFRCHHLPG